MDYMDLYGVMLTCRASSKLPKYAYMMMRIITPNISRANFSTSGSSFMSDRDILISYALYIIYLYYMGMRINKMGNFLHF